MLAMEKTADGVHQHGVGGSGVETAGFFQRQDPLHPPIALRQLATITCAFRTSVSVRMP